MIIKAQPVPYAASRKPTQCLRRELGLAQQPRSATARSRRAAGTGQQNKHGARGCSKETWLPPRLAPTPGIFQLQNFP